MMAMGDDDEGGGGSQSKREKKKEIVYESRAVIEKKGGRVKERRAMHWLSLVYCIIPYEEMGKKRKGNLFLGLGSGNGGRALNRLPGFCSFSCSFLSFTRATRPACHVCVAV